MVINQRFNNHSSEYIHHYNIDYERESLVSGSESRTGMIDEVIAKISEI